MSQSYHKPGFQINVTTDHGAWRMDPTGEDTLVKHKGHTILTTHNGYQWSGLSTMTLDEMEVFQAYITDYIRENKE